MFSNIVDIDSDRKIFSDFHCHLFQRPQL